MSIKRYSIESGIYSPPTGPLLRSRLDVEEAEDGPWVKYDDHVAEVERLTADRDYHRNTSEARIAAVTRAHKREDKKQATIDRLTADLAAARADFFAVADRLGTMYEPDMGPRYPGTLADVLCAIDAVESERDQARAERDGLAADPRLAFTLEDLRWASYEANQTAKRLVTVAGIHPTWHSGNATTALARAERFGAAHRAALAALPPKEDQ